MKKELSASVQLPVRFSEVDSMNIVWHGSYALYFEEAREAFGRKYDLGYLRIFKEGYYAPLVKLDFNYKRPLAYGSTLEVEITYRPTEAAKICFDYQIFSDQNTAREVMATGSSTQVFLDKAYQLVWDSPSFYREWKKQWVCM